MASLVLFVCLSNSRNKTLFQKYESRRFHILPNTVSNGTTVKMENQAITFVVRKFAV